MATVQINQSRAGSTVRLAVVDQAELTLPETRTAGYSWKVVSAESPVFSVKDEGFARVGGVGGTGVHRWMIAATKKGLAELELAYGRSWETAAGKNFVIVVAVE